MITSHESVADSESSQSPTSTPSPRPPRRAVVKFAAYFDLKPAASQNSALGVLLLRRPPPSRWAEPTVSKARPTAAAGLVLHT
jgi:hypothetical protein